VRNQWHHPYRVFFFHTGLKCGDISSVRWYLLVWTNVLIFALIILYLFLHWAYHWPAHWKLHLLFVVLNKLHLNRMFAVLIQVHEFTFKEWYSIKECHFEKILTCAVFIPMHSIKHKCYCHHFSFGPERVLNFFSWPLCTSLRCHIIQFSSYACIKLKLYCFQFLMLLLISCRHQISGPWVWHSMPSCMDRSHSMMIMCWPCTAKSRMIQWCSGRSL
jgi:hypothetical protein